MSLDIVIVGGGICGLSTAIALQKVGLKPQVYEQTSKLGEVGAGITLWHNATSILDQLNVYDEIITAGIKFEEGGIYKKNGDLISLQRINNLDYPSHINAVAIHRAKLQDILYKHADPKNVKFSKELIDYKQHEDSVTAYFKDGTQKDCDLLIGADGINSSVRNIMHSGGWNKRYSGYTAYRGLTPTNPEFFSEIKLNQGEYWGKGNRFGFVPLNEDQIYWFATNNVDEDKKIKKSEYKLHLIELFDGWSDIILSIINKTPEGNIIRNNIYDLSPIKSWVKDRVVILGDAAHAVTPNIGQGACIAIEDAVGLTNQIIKYDDLASSLQQFQDQRYKRTKRIGKLSNRVGNMGQWSNSFSVFFRNILTKLLNPITNRVISNILNYKLDLDQ